MMGYGAKRHLPYDVCDSTGTVYRDGVQFDQKTHQSIVFENASQLVLGGFQEAAGIVSNFPVAPGWQVSGYDRPGKIVWRSFISC